MQIKYFIYCRKSSEQEDRQILSLPAQVKELQSFAKKERLQVVEVIQESKSAHKAGRPRFDHMVERIQAGEANGVIVWDESRLARNAKDSGTLIYMLDLEELIEIRKPGKTYINCPDDKSWLGINFTMSKKESDDKGVNVKRGLRAKAESGWCPSSITKPGYMWDKYAERGSKTIIKDPIRFPLIKQAWEYLLSGSYTVAQILHKLNNDWGYTSPIRKSTGGKPMYSSQLYRIFSDPFYYGYFEYKDSSGNKQLIKGKHQSMISEEEFNKVQILLGRPNKQRSRKHNFPLTGIIRCGKCGGLITAEEKWQLICPKCKHKFASKNKTACPKCHNLIKEMINPKVLHYIYYHCGNRSSHKCTQKSIKYEDLCEQIDNKLKQLTISDRFVQWAIKYLNKLNEEEQQFHSTSIKQFQKQYDDCQKKLDNLLALKISPKNIDSSLLSDEEYASQKEILIKRKTELKEKIENFDMRFNNWTDQVENHFSFATNVRQRFNTGSAEEKREILSRIGSNLTLFNKTLDIKFEKEYSILESATKKEPSTLAKFEPRKKQDESNKLEKLWGENPLLQGGKESNPHQRFWRPRFYR